MANRIIVSVVVVILTLNFPCYSQQPNPPQPAEKSETAIRLRTNVVSLTVSVTDHQNVAVAGLEPQQFELYENNIKQTIAYFKCVDEPLSIGIILDLSGSMGKKIHHARAAVKSFLDNSHADDDYFLIGFNQQCHLLADVTDADSLMQHIKNNQPEGETALLDAVFLGIEKLKFSRHAKRALLIVSDGEDNRSHYTKRELFQRLKEEDLLVYCLGYNMRWRADGDDQGQFLLEDLARGTGGRAFFPRSQAKLEDALSTIALELRRQYSIGYTSSDNRQNGHWRKIRVHVSPPPGVTKFKIRTRTGYFADAWNAKVDR